MGRHGLTRTPAYYSWVAMKDRCLRPANPAYRHYGGRGIAVCERWLQFEGFFADMGARPAGTTLDRINNNGNYEPGNCRWATDLEQARNTRVNRLVEFHGRATPVSVVAEAVGMGVSTLRERLRRGWSVEDAIAKPVAPPFKLDPVSVECMRIVYSLRVFTSRQIARWWGVSRDSVFLAVSGEYWPNAGGPLTRRST